MVYSILVIVQVVVALSLIGLILVQHGKGADAGAAFGSGASGTVFGAKGSANFLSHATAALATVFFLISLTLAYLINGASAPTGSVVDQLPQQHKTAATQPAATGGAVRGNQKSPGSATGGQKIPSADNPPASGNSVPATGADQGSSSSSDGAGTKIPQ